MTQKTLFLEKYKNKKPYKKPNFATGLEAV